MNWAAIVWLVLIPVFLMIEASTVMLVSIWFALGSLAALLLSLLGASVGLQAAVFLIVSAISLTALRPLVRKYINPKLTKTNADAVVGTTGLVTVAIDNVSAVGQVKLGAMYWSARSTAGDKIPEGALVRVDKIEGVKVFVTPMEVSANV
ncbi:MAG: NfeD family protein [Oscillospiraceae bacterium]|nr:NfeD family protein [Oscillospiraceae bacterium]